MRQGIVHFDNVARADCMAQEGSSFKAPTERVSAGAAECRTFGDSGRAAFPPDSDRDGQNHAHDTA